MKKIMFGTSDAWSTSHSSQRTSKPAYSIVDCRILIESETKGFSLEKTYRWTMGKIKAQILLEVNWKEETDLQTLFKQQ